MNKRFYLLGLLSVLLLGAGVSCKDKDKDKKNSYCTQSPGNCESVLAAKEFFLFKEGSWWVYEEETSHERDSVYVTEYVNSSSYDFDMRVKSALTDYEYHYSPFYVSGNQSCSQVNPVVGKCLYINRSKGKPGDYIGEGYCFFVNTVKGDWAYITGNIYFENNKISVEDSFQEYDLGILHFGKTYKIHELNTRIEGIQPTNHYYSEGVGLIKKELLDSNQVWNLVSYHIAP